MRWILGLIGVIAIIAVAGYFVLKRDDIPYETLAAKYETPASRYVDLPGGVHMHYRDEGAATPADGQPVPTILLVHGFSASLQTWEPLVQQLTGEGYRVISIDLPGHGLTRAPAGYHATIPAFVDAVYAFTQSMHLNRFAIAGNSMGGEVAWNYALAHPDQLDGLILVDAGGWPHDEQHLANPVVLQLMTNSITGPIVRSLDSTAIFRSGLRNAYADPAHATEAIVARYVELARAPGHRDILMQLQSQRGSRRPASNEALAPVSTPTLILWGREDHLIPVADADKFREAIQGSHLIVYDHVGHLPQEENTDATATDIHEFLYAIHERGQEGAVAAE